MLSAHSPPSIDLPPMLPQNLDHADTEARPYQIAVRALCEFTAKAGDLDLRFTPSPTAQEGIAGHVLVASRRGKHYQSEVPLAGTFHNLQVRGRADGYDPHLNQLEEVKTYRGDLSLMPANHRHLHWAQVKIYGWLLCQQLGLQDVRLALVYFNIVDQQETLFSEVYQAETLQTFFEEQCSRFLAWAEQELAHRQARDQALAALRFPHGEFRAGQRTLAEAVYKATHTGRCLLAEAPTGIGKTIGTLFPMLKAMPGQQLDKIFSLAAKTPGRQLALDAARQLQGSTSQIPLRVLELTARDKACEHPDKACHGDSCPLAQGFYDRLPLARQAAAQALWLDQAGLREIALAHQICPYYLAQEMARWTDVVVGDYNYFFDIQALLYALTTINQWRVGLLVDEAHNLVERARKMYTAELDQETLRAVRKSAPAALKKPLERVARCWRELTRAQSQPYQVYRELPSKLLGAMQQAIAACTDYFTEHPFSNDSQLQTWFFEMLQFCRLAELFDAHFLFDVQLKHAARPPALSVLCIRNLVPAPFLRPRLQACYGSVLYSATLKPWHYYRDLLGLPENHAWLEVESPFQAAQLDVYTIANIATRYHARAASVWPIAELIATQFQRAPGNYLAFFSSFEYLEQVADALAERFPQVPQWRQSRRMEEAERARFLDQFTLSSQGIGFAVLGGVFGEGIDLPGERLIGAFVATLGLPQVNPVNEQIKQRMDELFGQGYDYTYLYPGIQKVVQAAGRVIRTPTDRGVVYLIDDRFGRRQVKALLPGWWRAQ